MVFRGRRPQCGHAGCRELRIAGRFSGEKRVVLVWRRLHRLVLEPTGAAAVPIACAVGACPPTLCGTDGPLPAVSSRSTMDGHVVRTIALPETAKLDTAKPTFSNGMLEVSLDVPAERRAAGRQLAIDVDTPSH